MNNIIRGFIAGVMVTLLSLLPVLIQQRAALNKANREYDLAIRAVKEATEVVKEMTAMIKELPMPAPAKINQL